ncbi:MAG: TetR/AcrR family transcriptional regulator [Turicibacter sp.]
MSKSKKDMIYHAVIDIIKTDGIHSKFTISQVAQKANIGKGTIYEYYSSKEQLYAESIVTYINESLMHSFDQDKIENKDFETSLKYMISQFVIYFSKNYQFFQLFLLNDLSKNENSMRDEVQSYIQGAMKEIQHQSMHCFHSLATRGRQEGILKNNLSAFELQSAQILLSTSVFQFFSQHPKEDIERHLPQFIENLYHVIIKILM